MFYYSYGNTITIVYLENFFAYVLFYDKCDIIEIVTNDKEFFMKKINFNLTDEESAYIKNSMKKKVALSTNLTQSQIAELMGAKQPQVSNWLNGKRIPSAINLIRLADILNEYPEELLTKLEKIKQENCY
jgi:predicted XRE-type DNA-binding protein